MKGVLAIKRNCEASLQRLARLQDQERIANYPEAQRVTHELEVALHRCVALSEELTDYEVGREFYAGKD